jgi:virginiamycin B lyase
MLAAMTAANPAALAASLPAEPVGSTFDISVPGPQLGSTHEIVVGPDGNIWFTQQSQDRVGRMTINGQFTFFSTGVGSGPHGIAFDAQGRLWITRQFSNTITQMDLNGNIIANHVIPFPNANPHGLTIARDGKVWFTGREGNVVGYYNPKNNKFRIFPLPFHPVTTVNPEPDATTATGTPAAPNPGNFPIYISEAADGSMYFTELLSSRIGRITPSGKLTEYLLPSKFGPPDDARPIAVRVRPDGVAVATEESGHAYAYIYPNGRVKEFPLNPSDAKAASLVYDRMGVLWVQYNTPDNIGRVNPDGSVTPFPIPTIGATQHRIIIGPDGELWFTELTADRIGRMVTGDAAGPALSAVSGQSYVPTADGLTYEAKFRQGQQKYNDTYTLTTAGASTQTDRLAAIQDATRNLQYRINHLAGASRSPTFGLKLPFLKAPGLQTQFRIQNKVVSFSQTESIDGSTYQSNVTLKLSGATSCFHNPANISSATAHYLEAVKFLAEGSATATA